MFKFIYDPNNDDPSLTRALLIIGFIIANIKLLLSGISLEKIKFGDFSGTDFAAVVGSLGAIYWGRRHTDAISKDGDK